MDFKTKDPNPFKLAINGIKDAKAAQVIVKGIQNEIVEKFKARTDDHDEEVADFALELLVQKQEEIKEAAEKCSAHDPEKSYVEYYGILTITSTFEKELKDKEKRLLSFYNFFVGKIRNALDNTMRIIIYLLMFPLLDKYLTEFVQQKQ
jgi:hypothetical protein